MDRLVNKIIVHCSATMPSMDIGAAEIRKWHVEERGWRDIGYHYVIRRNGVIEKGRDDNIAGAHCEGQNANSLGICLVGGIDHAGKAENNFTPDQFATLEALIRKLQGKYDNKLELYGHREFAPKDCPSFDIQEWRKTVGL